MRACKVVQSLQHPSGSHRFCQTCAVATAPFDTTDWPMWDGFDYVAHRASFTDHLGNRVNIGIGKTGNHALDVDRVSSGEDHPAWNKLGGNDNQGPCGGIRAVATATLGF